MLLLYFTDKIESFPFVPTECLNRVICFTLSLFLLNRATHSVTLPFPLPPPPSSLFLRILKGSLTVPLWFQSGILLMLTSHF
uniref:Uncharacterized protein n=1 Tax=Lates calcarifer TaxID=8187 RepID=A0A4W6DFF9_LATCA